MEVVVATGQPSSPGGPRRRESEATLMRIDSRGGGGPADGRGGKK